MCKIMVIPAITKDKIDIAKDFIYEMGRVMTKPGNDDGLGFAALTRDGELFGERWLNNDDAFDVRTEEVPVETIETQDEINKKYYDILDLDVEKKKKDIQVYNKFHTSLKEGEDFDPVKKFDEIVAITLHTRLATSPKGLINNHPFVLNNTSLIHNGMIQNYAEIGLEQSTCDSEAILNVYEKYDLANKNTPEQVNEALNALRGGFACGVFTKTNKNQWVLDVFKNISPSLGAVFVKELNTVVITTQVSDVIEVCKSLNLTPMNSYRFISERYVRINPFNGKVISRIAFDHRNYANTNYHNSNWNGRNKHNNHTQSNGDKYLAAVTSNHSTNESNKTTAITKDDLKTKIEEANKTLEARRAEKDGWVNSAPGVWERVEKK